MLLNYFERNLVQFPERDYVFSNVIRTVDGPTQSHITEGSCKGKKGYRSVKVTTLFHLVYVVEHENTWRCASLHHMLKQINYTYASYYKIKITTLFSSPLVTYRPINLIFQFGEIPLTRNRRLHTDKEMPRMNQRRDGCKDPVTREKNFQAIINLAQL